MDVNYITSDWEKAKQSVGSLIGNGWGRGMFDDLRKLTNNLEDVESLIRKYDSDGYISFHHTSQEKKYQQLFNDYQELHRFTKQVGGIVDDVIDQRFYEDMDAFVEAMRNLRIEEYTTENRIDATTIIHTHHAPGGSVELPKDEITLNDLFDGDNFYANQIKLEYKQVKEMNPDQEFSLEDYQLAALNTHAFEYESIKDQQYNKEFWAGLAALVVIVGATLIFPPAGIALAAIYGTLEITTMVSGKDWVSGRELEPGERWFRGLLAPLDIIPGVSGAKRLVTVGRVNRLHTLTDIGIQTKKFGTSIKNTIGNTVDIARTEGLKRLNQAKEFVKTQAKLQIDDVKLVIKTANDKANEFAEWAGSLLFRQDNVAMQGAGGGIVKIDSGVDVVKGAGNSGVTQGTGKNVAQGARYGERKISDETYGKLRRASPSSKIQREVNKNIDDIIGTEDFALPGKIINKKLHADHIVSLEKIARMEGFETLTYNQQKEIANYVENFIGLSEAANTSKGPKSYADWYIYKKENIQVNPEFRGKMILKEKELEVEIQKIIDEFNRKNKKE
ncbi:hypothetical protein [Pseudogracilibacillus auburnensis]|uniref:hypothetical protein n=1 Tax=Pseudogracilibacillus auburnensis TaxID=1494959 RepID=UPI001F608096|nr:hypothetical protein [Pseudogracilibacillus auburnensis]